MSETPLNFLIEDQYILEFRCFVLIRGNSPLVDISLAYAFSNEETNCIFYIINN